MENNMSPGEMHEVMSKNLDGKSWAQYFLATVRQTPPPVVDEPFMTAWFCNAIMAGYDAGVRAANNKQIEDVVKQVESSKLQQMILDPNGRYPVCIPKIGRGEGVRICERCGKPIDISIKEACSAVPPEERWNMPEVK